MDPLEKCPGVCCCGGTSWLAQSPFWDFHRSEVLQSVGLLSYRVMGSNCSCLDKAVVSHDHPH